MIEILEAKQTLRKMYSETIAEMQNKNGYDSGVCLDQLVIMTQKRLGLIETADEYFVPEGFDAVQFMRDYIDVVGK